MLFTLSSCGHIDYEPALLCNSTTEPDTGEAAIVNNVAWCKAGMEGFRNISFSFLPISAINAENGWTQVILAAICSSCVKVQM